MTAVAGSGPSFASSQPSSAYPGQNQQQQSQSPSFNRLTSLPIDPWGSPGKQQAQVMQAPSTPGYTGSMGQFRTPPPGIGSVGAGGASNAFYSPSGGQNQQNTIFSPEGPYGATMSFHPSGSTVSSNHLYSNNNSPVQGVSSNVGNFTNLMNQTPHHQPSPQRPYSGSSSSRDSLQFLDEKLGSSPGFGPGYGPTLNSGNNNNNRSYQQPQQTSSQGYQISSAFGQSLQYPQQRQRHSSHNSTTSSHHTMFLGPIGGGLGSTGGSVNSDDISTEDESDDPFDDMRNRYHRSYHPSPQYPSLQHQQQQSIHGGIGFGSQAMSSVLANRRGSVPSMGSMYSNQLLYRPSSPQHHHQHYHLHHQQQAGTPPPPPPPHNVVRLSNSSSDLYGRKSLVSAMARHTLNDHTATAGSTNTSNNNSGFNSPSRGTPISGSGAAGSLAGFSPGFGTNGNGNGNGSERDLFSSGLGGIIGGGTISHSHPSPYNHHTHTNHGGQSNGSSGGYQQGSNAYDFVNDGISSGAGAFGGELVGGSGEGGSGGHVVRSSALMGSTLSASALPFFADSAPDRSGQHHHHHQQQQRMVGGWDH